MGLPAMVGIFVLLFFVAFVGGIAALIYFVVSYAQKQQQKRHAVWAAVARAHGLAYTGHEIVGQHHGLPVRVCTVTRGSGNNRTTYTVVSARLSTPLDLGLNLRRHGLLNDMFHRSMDIHVGDLAFDAAFIVSGDEVHRVRALLTDKLRALLLHHVGRSSTTFVFGDHGMTVECVGASGDYHWLNWAVELCARATAKLDQARHAVPVASQLAHHKPAWQAFAKAHGLRGLDTPLCMWGRIDNLVVHAYAVRKSHGLFELEVSVRFPHRLGIGLQVQPKGLMDKVAIFFGSQDHSFGDPVFDDMFRVKVAYPARCNEILDQNMRAQLLALQSRVGPTLLTDEGIAVRLPHVPMHPAAVPKMVQNLSHLAEQLGARGVHDDGVGPYR